MRGKIGSRVSKSRSRRGRASNRLARSINSPGLESLQDYDSTASVQGERSGHNFANISLLPVRQQPRAFEARAKSHSQLQSSIGKGDNAANLAPELEKQPVLPQPLNDPEVTEPGTPNNTVRASGTIQDIKTPAQAGRRTGEEVLGVAADIPVGVGNVVADIQLGFSQPKTDRFSGGKPDSVASGVSGGAFRQPGGRAVSPFGAEFYEPAFTGISYACAGGKCTISAKLDVICPWGTNSGGMTDVPSATDAVVTKANWRAIKSDLEPSAVSPFKSPRSKYYSQSLVERHEKFHGTDDNAWSRSSGLGIVKAELEAGTVTTASAATDVANLIDTARTKLISENIKWYMGGGASHGSYAGEIRAYGDGKPLYQKLAEDVEKHGKSLP